MQAIKHAAAYTESQIMDAVFNAARANEKREPRQQNDLGKYRFTITFSPVKALAGHHLAHVYDSNGFVVGSAVVDEFDI